MTVTDIVTEVARWQCPLVEVTGGEPLLQSETVVLLRRLVELGYEVLLETNGSVPLPENRGWRVVMDIKCPGSGMERSFCRDNGNRLIPGDEIKFVVSDRADFDWACRCVDDCGLGRDGRVILMSPVSGLCRPDELAEWILDARVPVRLQLQIHKLIWPGGEPVRTI